MDAWHIEKEGAIDPVRFDKQSVMNENVCVLDLSALQVLFVKHTRHEGDRDEDD